MQVESSRQTEPVKQEDPTVPSLSPAERALMEHASYLEVATGGLRCINCQKRYLVGELVCPHCGVMLADGIKTSKFEEEGERPPSPKSMPVGQVFIEEQKPLIFEINGVAMMLPVANTLIIGRLSEQPGDPRPDVNLNAFDAKELGVSRQHVKVTRRHEFTYISDMGSSNGTFLNGRPLTGNYERLLRNGDELRLGHLKMRVKF
jgi:FHA domain